MEELTAHSQAGDKDRAGNEYRKAGYFYHINSQLRKLRDNLSFREYFDFIFRSAIYSLTEGGRYQYSI